MTDKSREEVGDLRRIAAWLAEDIDNDEAQGAACDLLAAAAALEAAEAQAERHIEALAIQDAETMRERDARRAAEAQVRELQDRVDFQGDEHLKRAVAAEAQRDTLAEAMQRVQQAQPNTLAWIRSHGIVFDGPLGTDPKNWQHIAFSIYTDLCEVETIARAALAAVETTEERGRRLALDEGVFE